MLKHAYLIMVHNNFGLLKKQLELLDDEKNDFYIHVDEKAGSFDKNILVQNIKKSNTIFISRRKVFWGDYTLTQTEIDLIKAALSKGNYSYLHLLSGQDLPIKSKKYIFDFFACSDKIYLCCGSTTGSYQEIRTRYYYPFIKTQIFRKSKIVKGLSRVLGRLQFLLLINRHKKTGNYNICYHGWQWFSIPKDFAEYVVSQEAHIYSTFHHTLASDESFLQTVAMNSDFKHRIFKFDCLEESVMRRIDWKRGRPYTFTSEDYHYIMNSPYLFARKFDESKDGKIIEMIFEEVSCQNKHS